jgi:hypothetical protein
MRPPLPELLYEDMGEHVRGRSIIDLRRTLFHALAVCKDLAKDQDKLRAIRRDYRAAAKTAPIEGFISANAGKVLATAAEQLHAPNISRTISIMLTGYMVLIGSKKFSRHDWRPLLPWLGPVLGVKYDPDHPELRVYAENRCFYKIDKHIARFKARHDVWGVQTVTRRYFRMVAEARKP